MERPTTVPPPGFATWWERNVTLVPDQTLADWRALPEGTRAELIDGTMVFAPTPGVFHQVVVGRFVGCLTDHLGSEADGLVLTAPLDVQLTDLRAFQPDIVFVASGRLGILGEQAVEGAPDLVAEVLSPSTGYYDVTAKRRAYFEAGVGELWLLDPGEGTAEVLTPDGDDFRTAARVVADGEARSVLLDGFAVDVAALFRPVS